MVVMYILYNTSITSFHCNRVHNELILTKSLITSQFVTFNGILMLSI